MSFVNDNSPFASEGAAPKPTLICVGQISSLTDVANTNGSERGKEDYFKITYRLMGTNPREQVGTFLFTPVFFEPAYSPRNDPSASHKFVYSNNIWRTDNDFNLMPSPNINTQRVGLPTLPGLCGSAEKFREVGEYLQAKFLETNEAEFAPVVQEVLTAIKDDENHQIGFVLKQQFQATGRNDAKGYPEKIPGKYYEIAGFFYPTDENVTMLEKKVEKFNNRAKQNGYKAAMTFSLDVPFATGATTD